MTPERAVALAAQVLAVPSTSLTILRVDDAITLATVDRIVRVMGTRTASGLAVVDWGHLLGTISRVLMEPTEQPRVIDDVAVLVFPRLPRDGGESLDSAAAGAALATFHAEGALYDAAADLPLFDPVALASAWIARARNLVSDAAASRMLAGIAESWESINGPSVILHGDAHAANWRADAADRWYLVDAEYLARGPAVYDLAPLEVVERRLTGRSDSFHAFRSAYEEAAGRVDDDVLAAAVKTRELLSAAWYAARDGARPELVARRVEDALTGRGSRWSRATTEDD